MQITSLATLCASLACLGSSLLRSPLGVTLKMQGFSQFSIPRVKPPKKPPTRSRLNTNMPGGRARQSSAHGAAAHPLRVTGELLGARRQANDLCRADHLDTRLASSNPTPTMLRQPATTSAAIPSTIGHEFVSKTSTTPGMAASTACRKSHHPGRPSRRPLLSSSGSLTTFVPESLLTSHHRRGRRSPAIGVCPLVKRTRLLRARLVRKVTLRLCRARGRAYPARGVERVVSVLHGSL
jgi:hypothetical protein